MAQNENVAAGLSYFLVGIIWWLADEQMKKSALVKFHVKQALNLLVISIVINIASMILFFLGFVWAILHFIVFVLWIFGLIYGFQGQKKEVPVVGGFAESYLKF